MDHLGVFRVVVLGRTDARGGRVVLGRTDAGGGRVALGLLVAEGRSSSVHLHI